MIIDCISDLHGFYPKLEGGDLLIVAGDLTAEGTPIEYGNFGCWIQRQSYKKKIVISGNHDNYFEMRGLELIKDIYEMIDVEYLCDSGNEFEGLKIWGSPWTKTFKGMNPHCKAFTLDTERELADKFEQIPIDTDILITHSPPHMILDETVDGRNCGSDFLWTRLKYLLRPKLHVFGHIHEAYGQEKMLLRIDDPKIKFVNASHVNEKYQPVNKPIRIEL